MGIINNSSSNTNKCSTNNLSFISVPYDGHNCVSRILNLIQFLWSPLSSNISQNYLIQRSVKFDDYSKHGEFDSNDNLQFWNFENSKDDKTSVIFCDSNIRLLNNSINFLTYDKFKIINNSNILSKNLNNIQRNLFRLNLENICFSKELNVMFDNFLKIKLNSCFSSVPVCLENIIVQNISSKTILFSEFKNSKVLKVCKTLVSKSSIPENSSCINRSIDVLNQELIIRKNKKLSKLSKKRRRRQKKKTAEKPTEKNKSVNSVLKVHNDISSNNFENKPTEHVSSMIIACESNDKNQKNVMNSTLSFILGNSCSVNSDSSSDSDFDSECKNTSLHVDDFQFECGLMNISLLPFPCSLTSSKSDIITSTVSKMSEELKNVNCQWQKMNSNVPSSPRNPLKVTFAPDDELVNIFPIENYDRKGEWETYALGRCRFKKRIQEVEKVLSPYLLQSHRDKICSRIEF